MGGSFKRSSASFLPRRGSRSFDSDQLASAQAAYARFGRSNGHRAGLNFGDCIAYAAASVLRRPLLFKGDDFTHTDIDAVRRKAD